MTIRSPLRSRIVQADVPFVRFEIDDAASSDEELQLMALHRILGSDCVYVVAINGYVGPSTAYEIG